MEYITLFQNTASIIIAKRCLQAHHCISNGVTSNLLQKPNDKNKALLIDPFMMVPSFYVIVSMVKAKETCIHTAVNNQWS